jgi:hypothetical protein
MKKDGFRPATMKELLSYGEKNPEEQRKYPIIGLGSVAELRGSRRVGCFLDEDPSLRSASLRSFDFDWHGRCRFLAVRN